jgi:hypothetical protein
LVWLRRYLLFAAEPYETIAFKVPSQEVDKNEGKLFTHCEWCVAGRSMAAGAGKPAAGGERCL